ncbi:MAG TPA: STAS domain-containing protein [Solirubrobacteraceae bacterium]|nr:STAS domain-containing protein [Solirubrobacteraceae bacterium]
MQSNFAVQTYITERAITLALSGELDLVSSPALERAMEDQAQSDLELIVIDMRRLEFMDSTGLHTVLRIQQAAHDAGRRFALIRGPDQVQRLFDLTGLAETLTIVDSPDQLLEGWAPPEPTVMP